MKDSGILVVVIVHSYLPQLLLVKYYFFKKGYIYIQQLSLFNLLEKWALF